MRKIEKKDIKNISTYLFMTQKIIIMFVVIFLFPRSVNPSGTIILPLLPNELLCVITDKKCKSCDENKFNNYD